MGWEVMEEVLGPDYEARSREEFPSLCTVCKVFDASESRVTVALST